MAMLQGRRVMPGRKTLGQAQAPAGWRAWYKTARWQRLRWQVLVEGQFRCARCGTLEGDTAQLVADHIEPHRGDAGLFWDQGNLQVLCAPCHAGPKQAEEARRR
jgi:5-methylcytosine-specific restriction protein A